MGNKNQALSQSELGQYRIIKSLGKGSFGEVYLVERLATRQKYAIKKEIAVIDDTKRQLYANRHTNEELNFFEQNHDHPFIVKYIEQFTLEQKEGEDSSKCIVLEYADQGSLADLLENRKEPFSENEALCWFTQALLALFHLHSKGYIHRDIKLENILIKSFEGGSIAQIGDFGTIKKDFYKTTCMSANGTVIYSAPEIVTGKGNFKIDIWALGIVLYEILTKREFPYDADFNLFGISALQTAPRNPWPSQFNISEEVRELIDKMLEKDPTQRPSAKEVLKHPIIMQRVQQITEEKILGEAISQIIFDQCKDFISLKEIKITKQTLAIRKALLHEAQYHAFMHEIEEVNQKAPLSPKKLFGRHISLFTGSLIINDVFEEQIIIGYFNQIGNSKIKVALLYRATRDGFRAKDFHTMCDNQRSTLTIIQTTTDCIIGGYTNEEWKNQNIWKPSTEGWLFSTLYPQPFKRAIERGGVGVGSHDGYEASFGFGGDLIIWDNSNINNNSWVHGGSGGKNYEYGGAHLLNGKGMTHFTTLEIEVYKVTFQ